MANSNVKGFLNDPNAPIHYYQTRHTASQPIEIPAARNKTSESIASSPESYGGSSSYTTSNQSILSRTASGSSAPSTAPSEANEPTPTLVQQQSNMTVSMPCLLRDTIGCGRSFPIYDFESWSLHNATHFGSRGPPTYSRCIFCNRAIFKGVDAADCWQRRMRHILNHFLEGYTLEDSKPDFELIKDLYRKGGINDADYHSAMSWTERPQVNGLRPLGYETKEVRATRLAEENKSNRIVIKESARSRRHK